MCIYKVKGDVSPLITKNPQVLTLLKFSPHCGDKLLAHQRVVPWPVTDHFEGKVCVMMAQKPSLELGICLGMGQNLSFLTNLA